MAETKGYLTPDEQKKADRATKVKKELIEYAKAILTAVVLAAIIMTFVAQSFYVDGMSMEPNYHHGERMIVDKISYRFSDPKRGDVIVFRYPLDTSQRFVKRVIGIPGDTVEIKSYEVYVNGVMLDEPYIYAKAHTDYGPMVVPEGTVFAMGDNRNNSNDSRSPSVGMISKKLIIGRGLFMYWPIGGIRICQHYRDYPLE